MISALAWVPKGASRRMPEKLKLTEGEMRMVQQMAADEAADENEAMEAEAAMEEEESDEEAAAASADDSGLPASFKMDEYDNEDDDAAITNYIGQEQGEPLEEEDSSDAEQDASSAEDADMDGAEAMNDGSIEEDEEEEDDELENDREDVEILPTDAVILVANTEEEFSNLEVQVYDDDNGSLYVHHEINLPAFPLSLAWMDCAPVPLDPTKGPVDGSFVAIGTFKPGIEIWDLNVLDVLEPSATLGGEVNEELREVALPKQSRRRKNKQVSLKAGSHQDSVMSLDWNSSHRNMLASGSADSTVKVWDITTQACLYTMSHHSNKVQSVRWNPAETTVLASASFDRTIVVLDGRQPDAFSKFALSAEVESITWAPHNPSTIVAATEDGMVAGYDVRMNGSAALFSFQAHAGAVSAVSFSSQIPGLFATAGVDKTVKIWDLKDNAPVCITSKDMNVGELFSMSFYQDSPYMLAVGGSKGVLALWDTSENEGVERRFSSRAQGAPTAATSDISASFRSPFQLGEELALQEEQERQQQQGKKKGKGRKNASARIAPGEARYFLRGLALCHALTLRALDRICDRQTCAFFDPSKNKYCRDEGFVDISPTADGGVLKKVIRESESNKQVEEGCPTFVQYIGRLLDGSIFDTTRDMVDGKHVGGTDDPFEFQLGREKVIKGWDIGVATMNKGEIARFIIAPEYAYGSEGFAPKVEPNETLDFEIELIRFGDPLPRFPTQAELAESRKQQYEEEKKMLEENPPPTIDERIASATEEKEKGNAVVAQKDYEKAQKHYDSCLHLKGFVHIFFGKEEWENLVPQADKDKVNAVKLVLYLNRSLCKIKLRKIEDALWDCDQAITLDATNGKGHFRRGLVYIEKLKLELEKEKAGEFWIIEKGFEYSREAEKSLHKATELISASDAQILRAFVDLKRTHAVLVKYDQKYKEDEKKLYKEKIFDRMQAKNQKLQEEERRLAMEQEFEDMPALEE